MQNTFSFGRAIEHLKAGHLVARQGWNGKGMSLVLIKVTGLEARTLPENVGVRPCIAMRDAQGMLVPGWLASQTDMLAEDWTLVEQPVSLGPPDDPTPPPPPDKK